MPTFEDSLQHLYTYVDSFHTNHAVYDLKSGYDFAVRYLDSQYVRGDSLISKLLVRSEHHDTGGKKYFIRNDFRMTANGRELSEQIMLYLEKIQSDVVVYTSSSYSFYIDTAVSSPMMVRVSEVGEDDIRKVMKRVFSRHEKK